MIDVLTPEVCIFWGIVLARLVVPLLILRWPLGGVAAAIILDFYDFEVFAIIGAPGPFGWEFYQPFDKVLDTYYLALLMMVAWGWGDLRLRYTAYGLFLWRLAGVVAFVGLSIVEREVGLLLLFAPNIFEFFVIAVLFFKAFFPYRRMSGVILVILLLLVSVGKLAHEYDIHGGDGSFGDVIPSIPFVMDADRVV